MDRESERKIVEEEGLSHIVVYITGNCPCCIEAYPCIREMFGLNVV